MKADAIITVFPHAQDRLVPTVSIRLRGTPVTSDRLSRSPVPLLFSGCCVYCSSDTQMNQSIGWSFRQIFLQEMLLDYGNAGGIVRCKKAGSSQSYDDR